MRLSYPDFETVVLMQGEKMGTRLSGLGFDSGLKNKCTVYLFLIQCDRTQCVLDHATLLFLFMSAHCSLFTHVQKIRALMCRIAAVDTSTM